MSLLRATTIGLAASLLLTACAAPAPRMQELGPNSYMVTVRAEENADGKKIARRIGREEADRLCEAKGQHAAITHITSGVSDYMEGGDVEVNFRCQDQPFNEP